MSQNPAHRAHDHTRGGSLPHIPTLGSTCFHIRNELGLSRAVAQQRHGISTSYLADIETDRTTPKPETLEKLIAGYELDPMRTKYLRELRSPAEQLPTADSLRRCVHDNVGLMTYLRYLDRRDLFAAYVDPLWNILASTDGFRSWLTGIGEDGNVRAWLFTPHAREVLTDWRYEAKRTVAVVKAALALYRDSEQARDLIRQLRPNRDVQRLWNSSTYVAYGRHVNDLLHRRDPDTHDLASYRISIADLTQNQHVQLVTAIRQPYSGPDPTDI
ncbi:helix-turn-helix domain-containing protein [Nocardia vinacea]|uniref:MmyB family transcriptional regulator n=1 Tax=Nocardia vinacea TaxID=96468 RepID=UPI002E0F06A2|nr:helix-turn-helix domain-containing protein [Nocardia vinacea]